MKLERVRPTAVRLTLHPIELATLVSAARWVLDGPGDPLPAEALRQLRQILASYDEAARSGMGTSSSDG
jgi:hypothetical protein